MYLENNKIFPSESCKQICKQMFVITSGYRQNLDYVTAFGTKQHRTAVYGYYIIAFISL